VFPEAISIGVVATTKKERCSMKRDLGTKGQVVEIDETHIGGKKLRKGVKAGKDAKIKVLGIVERNGRVHMQRVDDTTIESLKPAIDANLSPNASQVVTDSASVYSFILPKEMHKKTNHKEELRTTGELSKKTIEGAFRCLNAV
jgi:transposase-like protein